MDGHLRWMVTGIGVRPVLVIDKVDPKGEGRVYAFTGCGGDMQGRGTRWSRKPQWLEGHRVFPTWEWARSYYRGVKEFARVTNAREKTGLSWGFAEEILRKRERERLEQVGEAS